MRTGYVVARNQKAAQRWDARRSRALTPRDLDSVMRGIALAFPKNVKVN